MTLEKREILAEGGFDEEVRPVPLEADEWKSKYLRAMADIDNLRKRMRREHEVAANNSVLEFAHRLLPAKDAMERGLEMATESEEINVRSLLEGMHATLGMINKAFLDAGVEEIDPLDSVFDPELHEAVSVKQVPGVQAGLVQAVFEKGYVLNGRLIRPAKVQVSSENE